VDYNALYHRRENSSDKDMSTIYKITVSAKWPKSRKYESTICLDLSELRHRREMRKNFTCS
jgi:hypothetical protein